MEVEILAILAELVLEKLAAKTWEQIELAWNVESQRLKLQKTVSALKELLLEAEQRKNQGRQQLRDWLGELTDALYDVDNVLDEFHYHSLQRQVESRGGIVEGTVRRSFFTFTEPTFSYKMGRKIKKIRKTLDDIAADWSRLCLPELGVDMGIVQRDQSHSYVDPSNVIGRDHDKNVVIQHLRLWTETLSVIPIVGIEGIGKTTVAQLVYNDPWVAAHFELRMWVCVSKDFDVERLIKQIIDSAEGGNCGEVSMDEAQIRLRSVLMEKSFLLILDDVWNNDRGRWLDLELFLREGEADSKIIVTTQSRSVAAVMGTVPMHELSHLSFEDSLSLFTNLAFDNRVQERLPSLESIAQEIVERCGGVPQLLKTTACSLYSITEQRIWFSKRDTALKLRLDGLPSALRQCLALCSIFPTNFRFYSLRLNQLLMAQDFITLSHPNEDLEDAGHQYMDILYSRCVFQNREQDYGDFFYVQIHNLIHDHAREAAQPEYTVLNFHRNAHPSQTNIRHVSLSEDEWPAAEGVLDVLRALGRANKVRTILCPFVRVQTIDEPFISAFIERFKYMRVLDLSYSCFERLPESISDLIHLRLLSLRSNIRIRRLPNSICKLYNLQTLVLLDCCELEELPRDTKNMISLRHLEITTKQSTFPELYDSNSLRFLGIVGCISLRSLLREGQSFPALRTLFIHSCGSLVSLLPSIRNLTALRTLKIADCEALDLLDGDDDRFPGFQTLWFLVIVNLPMLVGLPQWILRTATSNFLQRVVIEACPNFTGLPLAVQQNITIRQKFKTRE